MGIVMCDPTPDDRGHEGYAIGLVHDPDGTIYSDRISYRQVNDGDVIAPFRTDVTYVQVACDCGWRSPVMSAPYGTEWAPRCVFFPTSALGPAWDDVIADIWRRQHIDVLTAATTLYAARTELREQAVTA